MMHIVYALIDPRTSQIRYVGSTDDMYRRYAEHLYTHEGSSKDDWINELKNVNLLPVMKALETGISPQDIVEREMYWITYYIEQGCGLTNVVTSRRDPKLRTSTYHLQQSKVTAIYKEAHAYDKGIAQAIKDLNIIPVNGCITTREATLVLGWRAKHELGIDHKYTEGTIKKRVYVGRLKPCDELSSRNYSYFQLDDIFSLRLSPKCGNGLKGNRYTGPRKVS